MLSRAMESDTQSASIYDAGAQPRSTIMSLQAILQHWHSVHSMLKRNCNKQLTLDALSGDSQ